MPNSIIYTDIPAANFVDQTSRYINSRVIYYGPKQLVAFTTYVRSIISQTNSDKFMIIDKGIEYRPDLLAWKAYGTPSLWWKIMEANNMIDILEFKTGVNIRIPGAVF